MARATSSLPTPVSPVMSTVVLKLATRRAERGLQAADLGPQLGLLLGAADAEQDLVRPGRFGQVVEGPEGHGAQGRLHVRVGRHEDDVHAQPAAADRVEELEAGHLRHHEVREDDVEVAAGDGAQRGLAVGDARDLVTLAPELKLQHEADILFVVGDEHSAGHGRVLCAARVGGATDLCAS
jgi:hypothetical protein